MPFALIGMFVAIKIWRELPAATKKYIEEVEQNPGVKPLGQQPT